MTDEPSHLIISISNEQSLRVDEDRIAAVARKVAFAEGAAGEISILLVDIARISELNERFTGAAGPTDVLAFPVDGLTASRGPEPTIIGEVVACPEMAVAQAEDTLDSELDLLVAHGVLHLLGHDHDTESRAALMRTREFESTGRSGARAS